MRSTADRSGGNLKSEKYWTAANLPRQSHLPFSSGMTKIAGAIHISGVLGKTGKNKGIKEINNRNPVYKNVGVRENLSKEVLRSEGAKLNSFP